MRSLSFLACLAVCVSGCAVQQLHKDQDQMRSALLDLYTNQIMDNLMRAHEGMPIIQLDYTNATGTITMKQSANINDTSAWTSTNVSGFPAMTLTATRNFVNTLVAGMSADRTNQVAVTATPLITSNEVYDAYLQFLAIPGSLLVSPEPPPKCAAHIWRQCGDMYYWIPVEYKGDFLNLALVTTAQRGKSFASPPDYFLAKIVDSKQEPNVGDPESKVVTLIFEKKIPNDSGYLVFDPPLEDKPKMEELPSSPGPRPLAESGVHAEIRDEQVEPQTFAFDRWLERPPGQAAFQPAQTDRLTIRVLNAHAMLLTSDALKRSPKQVRIFEVHNRPKAPTTEQLLQQANFQLQQIQFNQLRTGGQ